MFTGIVEEIGTVRRIVRRGLSAELSIRASHVLSDLKIGDSIAVSGVCLTTTDIDDDGFVADVMHETLERSSLCTLAAGQALNLERAIRADGRFGGHFVSGHIDATGRIETIKPDGIAHIITISAPHSVMRYIIEKGSVAIEGTSLTVTEVTGKRFSVSIIPHTCKTTTLGEKSSGDVVNLEADLIGKYVERAVRGSGLGGLDTNSARNTLTIDYLAEHGF